MRFDDAHRRLDALRRARTERTPAVAPPGFVLQTWTSCYEAQIAQMVQAVSAAARFTCQVVEKATLPR